MIPLTTEENKSCHEQNVCYICKKECSNDDNNKKCYKIRDHCHYVRKYRGAHGICNLGYKIKNKFL